MGKKRIQTTASSEAMRWAGDRQGDIFRGPGQEGNEFDVRMEAESDGVVAAEKIVDVLKEQGICVTEANAPHDLLSAAYDEAERLWDAGEFGPPMHVCDEESAMEAQLWQQVVYQDEQKVFWIEVEEEQESSKTEALRLLAQNMMDFSRGLGEILHEDTGIYFSHLGNVMLSCYTGDRTYNLHIDNPHAGSVDALPDNGLRLTLCYYINPHWDPESGDNSGGLDVYLTNPRETPSSASAAKKARRIRVAPHADTLVLFLSERMAHQVIPTKGKDRWFCLTMWCFDQDAMQEFTSKFQQLRMEAEHYSDDEDVD